VSIREEDANAAAWLRPTLIPGVGSAGQRALLKTFGSPEAVFEASAEALASVLGVALARTLLDNPTSVAVASALEWARLPGHTLLTLDHDAYPPALFDLPDPPSLLYASGDIEALQRPALAVVGSRNATAGGLQSAERFSRTFAESGFAVISGLALGIDSAAHLGALSAGPGARTVAVVGTGIDRVYPARNQGLARRIVAEGGLIISEFPLGTGVQAHHFPRRNRIIAGLSKGVLVVEAATESGSLITARLGGDLGREIFAIPGSIHSPQSRGCHRLIREGAKLVETAQDVFEEISPPGNSVICKKNGSMPLLGNPILEALGGDPVSLDLLVERSNLTADAALAMLFELELAGHVATLPGGRYQRLG